MRRQSKTRGRKPMDLELKNKVAIITGGSQGIGKAAALRLAAEGASVVIAARGRELLDKVALEIRAAGGSVAAVQADVSRAEDCAKLVAEAVKAFGRLDILVNNAGTSATGEFESVTDEIWQADFELKLFAAIRLARRNHHTCALRCQPQRGRLAYA